MGTELVHAGGLQLRGLDDYLRLSDALAKAPSSQTPNPYDVLLKLLAGAEMGFAPFASATGIHLIDGKPSLGSNLQAAAIRSSGRYDYEIVQSTAETCSIKFKQRDGDKWRDLGTETVTLAEAKASGWTSFVGKDGTVKQKAPWQKTPKNMLFARAITNGFKFYCPDLIGGIASYNADELDAEPVQVTVLPSVSTAPPTVDVVPVPATKPVEKNGSTPPPPFIQEGKIGVYEVENLKALCRKLPEAIYVALNGRYQVPYLSDIPAIHYQDAVRWLQERIAANGGTPPELLMPAPETPAAPPAGLPPTNRTPTADLPHGRHITMQEFQPLQQLFGKRGKDVAAQACAMLGIPKFSALPVAWLPVALDMGRTADLDQWRSADLQGRPFAMLTEDDRQRIINAVNLANPRPANV